MKTERDCHEKGSNSLKIKEGIHMTSPEIQSSVLKVPEQMQVYNQGNKSLKFTF